MDLVEHHEQPVVPRERVLIVGEQRVANAHHLEQAAIQFARDALLNVSTASSARVKKSRRTNLLTANKRTLLRYLYPPYCHEILFRAVVVVDVVVVSFFFCLLPALFLSFW